MTKAWRKIVKLEKAGQIKWSALYDRPDLSGYRGEMRGGYNLALFQTTFGWQLWVVHKQGIKSKLIDGPTIKLASRVARRLCI